MEELASFTNNQMVLCICPKCRNISRFSDLRIISTKKTPETWLDGFEKKLTKMSGNPFLEQIWVFSKTRLLKS